MCLSAASYLVEIGNGRVVRQGTIGELRRQGQLSEIIQTQDDTTEEEQETIDGDAEITQNNLNEADVNVQGGEPANADGGPSLHNGNIGKLIDEEARAEGRVSLWTYWTYIRYVVPTANGRVTEAMPIRAASIWSWFATLLLLLALRGITIGSQLFLAQWSEAYGRKPIADFYLVLFRSSNGSWPWLDSLPPPSENSVPWLLIYFSISLLGALTVLTYITIGYWSSLLASRSLFIAMLNRVVRAPSRWLDVTPVGRVLNRFVSDIGAVDSALNPSARAALSGTINFIASFLVIVLFVPTFLPFALVIAWLYIRIAPPFVRASRDLRRLESISLSPAFSGFDELLHGLVHVRAFGAELRYQEGFYKKVDR
jgi:ABC-type multidrug transport system fused ATPase/permease subunit